MYLFDFFSSLELLEKQSIPNIDIFPKKDVFYFGYCKKNASICGDDEYYITYVYRDNVKVLHYLGIDDIVAYIQALQQEPYLTFSKEYAATYEAIWLFDELNAMNKNPFFEMVLSVPLPTISSSFSNTTLEEGLIIEDFNGNPLLKTLYIEQFLYFIKKYLQIKARGDIDAEVLVHPSNTKLGSILHTYLKKLPLTYSSFLYTKEHNSEFDDFIQQLNYISNH